MSHDMSIDESDLELRNSIHSFLPVSDKVHVDELEEKEGALIRKTVAQMSHIATPAPGATGPSLVGRAHHITPISLNTARIEEDLETHLADLRATESRLRSDNPPALRTPNFPNLAWESVKAGLAQEKLTNDKLNGYIKEAEKNQKDIDLLLDFSAELTAQKEDVKELSEKMKDLLAKLKERDIDLWKGEDQKVNKEKISELKSLASAQVDKLRSNLQILFTTKIQVQIQNISAIMETLKDIIRNNTKLINTANRLPGH